MHFVRFSLFSLASFFFSLSKQPKNFPSLLLRTVSVSYTQLRTINFHGRTGEPEPNNERSRALSEINNAERPLCRELSNFPMESKC